MEAAWFGEGGLTRSARLAQALQQAAGGLDFLHCALERLGQRIEGGGCCGDCCQQRALTGLLHAGVVGELVAAAVEDDVADAV